jgi:hypothetical protein
MARERITTTLNDKYLSTSLFVKFPFIGKGYSYLNALIGSVREAFKAGKKPEIRPKMAHETKEIIIHPTFTT